MRRALALLALGLTACSPRPPPPPTQDAGEPEPVVYDGPTQNGGIPDLPEGFQFDASIPLIDSGVIVVDTRCCTTNFSVSDQEPAAGVTGVLQIGIPAFANGVPLTRSGGRWAAQACFPVNQSAEYRYQFTHDAGVVDAGFAEDDDGGVVHLEYIDIRVSYRASDEEPSFELADGTRTNFFRSVSSCDGLDGSVPP